MTMLGKKQTRMRKRRIPKTCEWRRSPCHHLSKDTFLSPLQNLIDGGLRSSMSFVPFRGGAQALID